MEIILGGGQGFLKRERYGFYLENESYLWLDYYVFETRLTTRHKWVMQKNYNRFNDRGSTLKEEDINLTDNIKEMVRKQLLSQLKIEKWSERR